MQPIHLFTFKGIPVSFNPMFLLLILLLSINAGTLVECIIFAVCACIGVFIHELGHALVARHYKLNPEIIFHGMGGITNHRRASRPLHDFLITLAGPGANLILSGVSFGLMALLVMLLPAGSLGTGIELVYQLLNFLFGINLVWGIFNLIPVFPLDGSKLLNFLFQKMFSQRTALKVSSVISLVLLAGMFAYFLYVRNTWMIILSVMFAMATFAMLREAFGNSEPNRALASKNIVAEKAYERGLIAAREHDWKALEIYGNQMKKAASDEDQVGRAYEFLTIAATNQCHYEEALRYSKNARQSDAVKQATTRCKAHLSIPE